MRAFGLRVAVEALLAFCRLSVAVFRVPAHRARLARVESVLNEVRHPERYSTEELLRARDVLRRA